MTFFQKSGTLLVEHVEKSYMLQLKNIWKATSGYIPTQAAVLEDGNE